jgi:hypothetical protein
MIDREVERAIEAVEQPRDKVGVFSIRVVVPIHEAGIVGPLIDDYLTHIGDSTDGLVYTFSYKDEEV